MSMRIGLLGLDSSHAEDFLRHFNVEGRYEGMRVMAIADGEPARMDELAKAFPGLRCISTPDALIGSVDAVIVGHRDGALHRAAAVASLHAGRPTFVDKPLANTLADAKAIVAAATETDAPLLSGSALRWQAATTRLKQRLAAIAGQLTLAAYGTWYPQSEYGGAIFYAIHTVELVQELLGPAYGPVTAVPGPDAAVQFDAGRADVMLAFRPLGPSGESAFGVTLRGGDVTFSQPIPLGDDYMAPVCDRIAKMLRTGRSSLTAEALLAPIRLMDEIDAALARG